MTHTELIEAAAKWAQRRRYRVVLRDVRCNIVSEQPDVIAWKTHGASVVVEAKTSRADFLRDRHKAWRRYPEEGMGYERYYAVESESILDGSVAGWGILVVNPGGRIRVAKKSGPFTKRNEAAERTLLVSAVARVTEGWGRRMFGASAPMGPDGDAPPSTARVIREMREEVLKLKAQLRAQLKKDYPIPGEGT